MCSSSFLNINGDKKQNKITLFCYLILNLFQNLFLSLSKKNFDYIRLKNKFKKFKFNNHHSISRKLCTLFWQNLNWSGIVNVIGKLDILELGTGNGNYFKKYISIKDIYIKKYRGYDVVKSKNWKKLSRKKFYFKKFDGKTFEDIFKNKFNLVISQSCLEHVRYDLKFFQDIKRLSNKRKILLIHCLPSPFCLFTYLAHGFRQYNIQNLNKISSIIGSSNLSVVKLGNLNLNLEHLKKTTLPLILKNKDLMKNQNKLYYNNLNKQILKNSQSTFFFSSFIVMVGFINFSKSEKNKLKEKIYL